MKRYESMSKGDLRRVRYIINNEIDRATLVVLAASRTLSGLKKDLKACEKVLHRRYPSSKDSEVNRKNAGSSPAT